VIQKCHPTSTPRRAKHATNEMEEDRVATNLGPEVDEAMIEEPTAVPKQPKRRFVGRKTAVKSGEQSADPNANIEDSSAIQGVRCLWKIRMRSCNNMCHSRPAPPHCPSPERYPRRHPARQRHQRCNRSPSAKLQLRDPQMHTSHTHIWRQVSSTAVSRGAAALRYNYLRHPHAVLPWHHDSDHGRRYLRRMLHR
jgi:hypothetical protein